MIQEEVDSFERSKQIFLSNLNEFKNRITNLRSKIISLSDEILETTNSWIQDTNKQNRRHQKKIFQQFQRFVVANDYRQCFDAFQSLYDNSWFGQTKFLHKQQEYCGAISFNNEGNIMISGCDQNIKVWKFDHGQLSNIQTLEGHSNQITCFVFSKLSNWFASGSSDSTIGCWKELSPNYWVSSPPEHRNQIFHLLLTKNENQLISCGSSIQVWRVNTEYNFINHDYYLENRHSMQINSITTLFCQNLIVMYIFQRMKEKVNQRLQQILLIV